MKKTWSLFDWFPKMGPWKIKAYFLRNPSRTQIVTFLLWQKEWHYCEDMQYMFTNLSSLSIFWTAGEIITAFQSDIEFDRITCEMLLRIKIQNIPVRFLYELIK